jgi:methanogenic corrinoid protein MtbC1
MAASKEHLAAAVNAAARGSAPDRRSRSAPRAPASFPSAPARAPLARTLDGAVIPRLVLAGRVERARREGGEVSTQDDRVGKLAELVLVRDSDAARSFVDTLHDGGTSFERLYLDVVGPAAHRLGELWNDDRCHFTDVTLAMSRLHHVLHQLGHGFYAEDPHLDGTRRALLLPAPGEQHAFGLAMVAEFFRRAGWDVWSGAVHTREDLLRLVGRERFDLVGLSMGCEGRVDDLPALVHAIRHRSRNHDAGVFVGGPAFVAHPELATAVGADATALDGRQAVEQAEQLLAMRATESA